MTWFFSLPFFTCYEQENCEVGAFFCGLITRAEFENPSSTGTVMKWETDVQGCNFLYLLIFFLLRWWDILRIHFVPQSVMINIFYPPNHLKRQFGYMAKWLWKSPLSS